MFKFSHWLHGFKLKGLILNRNCIFFDILTKISLSASFYSNAKGPESKLF